jgi:hypothetical protein
MRSTTLLAFLVILLSFVFVALTLADASTALL